MSTNNNLEIEKKYLIEYPNFSEVNFDSKVEITQSYLTRQTPEVERRIRSWKVGDHTKYYYTQKRFLTGYTREEIETEVSKEEYDRLSLEVDTTLVTVEKFRYTLQYQGLTFEVDVYPFSKQYAILEVELQDEQQSFTIPNGLNVLKDVTGVKEYANIPLCVAQSFPKLTI